MSLVLLLVVLVSVVLPHARHWLTNASISYHLNAWASNEHEAWQQHAQFEVGQAIRVFAVGSSNVLYVPWLEQLYLLLRWLGYHLPTYLPESRSNMYMRDVAMQLPTCDDAAEIAQVRVGRIGLLGWSSWGFAYDGDTDCVEGYREIAGLQVSCSPGWSCPSKGPRPMSVASIAEAASQSDVTLLSCWINDSKEALYSRLHGGRCYETPGISPLQTANISAQNLLRIIRAIHARNANVSIVVLALYPDVSHEATGLPQAPRLFLDERSLPTIEAINSVVRRALQGEPRTIFADYSFPGAPAVMFQSLHGGHPNCRGGKLMANAVVDALFRGKVLERGVPTSQSAQCPLEGSICSTLSLGCCQLSALCHVVGSCQGCMPSCMPYSPGG